MRRGMKDLELNYQRRRRHAEHAGPVPRGARDARELYLHGPAPPRPEAVAPALYVVSVMSIYHVSAAAATRRK